MDITYGADATSGHHLSYQHDRMLHATTPHGHIFGVFDGHGSPQRGHVLSHFCATRFIPLLQQCDAWSRPNNGERHDELVDALQWVVHTLEREAFEMEGGEHEGNGKGGYPGTTLCVAVIKEGWLYCANVGDSRAVMGVLGPERQSGMYNSLIKAEQLTTDHSCDEPSERRRIEQAGGFVVEGRLNGKLNMSRCLGDFEFKQYRNSPRFSSAGVEYADTLLVATPDIRVKRLQSDDLFIILGSDGLFSSRVTNEMVVLQAESNLVLRKSATETAQDLVRLAVEYHSVDNISALVVKLNDLPPKEAKAAFWRRKRTVLSEDVLGRRKAEREEGFDIFKDQARLPRELTPILSLRYFRGWKLRMQQRRSVSRPPDAEQN